MLHTITGKSKFKISFLLKCCVEMFFCDVNKYLESLFTIALEVCATALQADFTSNIIILPAFFFFFLELMEYDVNLHMED